MFDGPVCNGWDQRQSTPSLGSAPLDDAVRLSIGFISLSQAKPELVSNKPAQSNKFVGTRVKNAND